MASGPYPLLTEEIAELVASGVDIVVATRDRDLAPESMAAVGGWVHPDGHTLTVYLPELLATATERNLRENGEVAVTMSRPADHKSVQVKGKFVALRPSSEADRQLQLVGRAALVEQFVIVGVPRSTTRRLVWWPSLALEVRAESVFEQTPGPRAGEPLRAGSALSVGPTLPTSR
jgi:Pyridoxamine 5'-phosphate oxidase